MKFELTDIKGVVIDKLPENLKYIGDLLNYDGPLMSVYSDDGKIFIYDWVEVDVLCNRWMLYEVAKGDLEDYVFGKSTHISLLNNAINNLIYLIDKDKDQKVIKSIIVSPLNVPYDYLPNYEMKFENEDAFQIENIIATFKLQPTTTTKQLHKFDILAEAIKEKNELINLHIYSKSSQVGFGKIRSSLLGEVLTNFHKLNEATALNLFDSKSKIAKEIRPRRKKGELKSIKELADYEFIYAKAASFSVFLRPIRRTIDLFDNETSSEKIAKQIFRLFEASINIDALREIKEELSEGILEAYNQLLHELKEKDISLDIQYGNPEKRYAKEENFTLQKSCAIIENIDKLEYEDKSEIAIKGSFKALDLISNSFKFKDIEDEIYFGKFSPQLTEGVYLFNLKDFYTVHLEIVRTKKSGKIEYNQKIIMVSCIVEEE